MPDAAERQRHQEIAIIGMAGRFPGASDTDALWRNLCAGIESLSTFSREELLDAGVGRSLIDDPDHVPVHGVLDGAEMFAAAFFGYSARDALFMDPQQRHFLECAWEALESAGYGQPAGRVGVYAGVSASTYLLNRLARRPDLVESLASIDTSLGNDKDFLAARVAYKLDLGGPAVVVQSACSSSLLATHLACQAIRTGDCDMALAGGTSIDVPQRAGYLFRPEGIYSSDGRCRPFDARADGMVAGSGAAVVVLKELAAALRDGDTILAVIRGSAINNDGANKVGFTAPSVDAQAGVISAALRNAGVEPETVGYVEAHGTGTGLGDPIEIAALTQAFDTSERRFCAVGAVKANLGHLSAAAGVAGLVKTVLVLRHGKIPPSPNFETPNPHIDFENSPFFVNRTLRDWGPSAHPRRAGVSSFGMGGTNVHVVLEEAPPATAASARRDPALLVMSAKTPEALTAIRGRLADRLASASDPDLHDTAFTLQVGRRALGHRAALVCANRDDAVDRLRSARALTTGVKGEGRLRTAFLLPGQGAQYPGMARSLYESRRVFRGELDRCLEAIGPGAAELRALLLSGEPSEGDTARLARTELAQSALFAVQYALAALWRSLGVRPDCLIGHSIGEYTAACLAGVVGLNEALALVAERGRLLQALPPGAMLAVSLDEAETAARLGDGLTIAAVNAPGSTVVSGPSAAVAQLEEQLEHDGIAALRLGTSHGFHSPMMEPAADALRRAVSRIELAPPRIPFASNVTGTWISDAEATDPDYWVRHLLSPVRFSEGLGVLLARGANVLLEVGPGSTLGTLARRQPAAGSIRRVVASLPGRGASQDGNRSFLKATGELWSVGVDIDWAHADDGVRRRVPLPTYPFERQRFLIEAVPGAVAAAPTSDARAPVNEWCYVSSWYRSARPATAAVTDAPTLVFSVGEGLADRLARPHRGQRVIEVQPGESWEETSPDRFRMNPFDEAHYERLLEATGPSELLGIVHGWALPHPAGSEPDRGFASLLLLARALGRRSQRADLVVVTNTIHQVLGDEPIDPDQAMVLGPCRVIPLELQGSRCRNVDFAWGDQVLPVEVAAAIEVELLARDAPAVVAYRHGRRWLPRHEPLPMALQADPAPPLPAGSVCVVTGGFGGIGSALAAALADTAQTRFALLGRTPLPSRQEWDDLLASDRADPRLARAIRTVRELESRGAGVLPLAADVADRESLGRALEQVRCELGPIDCVVHAAGLPGGGALELKSLEQARRVMAAKVVGTRNLWSLLAPQPPKLFVLCSSLASEVGGFGQIDYCAANAYQDAFATAHDGDTRVLAIDWETWSEVGMALETDVPDAIRASRDEALRLGLRTREAQHLFLHLISTGESRILVSTRPLAARLATAVHRSPEQAPRDAAPDLAAPRPNLSSEYSAPGTPLEREIAAVWERLFGLEQVGRNDDFFELGGHSLLATQMLNRLRKTHPDARLSLATLFEAPSVAQLAGHIEAAAPAQALPGLRELAAMRSDERRAFFTSYLTERLSGSKDGSTADPVFVARELRRDFAFALHPHELEGAGDVGEAAARVAAIVAGEAPERLWTASMPPGEHTPSPSGAGIAGSKNPPILFLLSAPRSGSTLLRLMLAGHPGLFCPPELALLDARSMARWWRRQHNLFERDGLTRSLMELGGLAANAARGRVQQIVAEDRSIQEVYGELQRACAPRLLVDKSPVYALEPQALEAAEAIFDRPRYILMSRHPMPVVESVVRHRMHVLLATEPVTDPWRFAEELWLRANSNLLELGTRVAERCHHLRYEDLVRRPEATLRGLAGFLGIPYDPALLNPYGAGRMIDGPGDFDIFQHDTIEAGLADGWRGKALPIELREPTLRLAEQLGHMTAEEPVGPGEARRLLSRIDGLSDAEVEVALKVMLERER